MERKHILGFLGPLISTLFVLMAIILAPNFDWGSDPLSDLGNWFLTDIGPNPVVRASVFNGGLIIGGILICIYFLRLAHETGSLPTKVVLLGPAFTGLMLSGVGVFSENIPLGHLVTALGFFFSIPISAFLIGIVWLTMKEVRLFGVVALVLTLIAVILFSPWTSIAIWEFSMSIVGMLEAWFIMFLDMRGYLDTLKLT